MNRGIPTVFLVDHHQGVREAMVQLLEENGMAVCAQVCGLREAMLVLATLVPDLVLVDLIPDEENRKLVVELTRQGLPVVVCSSQQDPEFARRVLDAGARAYVAKEDAAQTLPRILRDVLNGWVLISPRAAE